VLGIVGESGCGKSVTMKAILQLVDRPGRITSGSMVFQRDAGPVDLAKLSPRGAEMRDIRGAEIALIPQEPMAAFSPVHTVGEQIIEAIMLHGHRWDAGARIGRAEARKITIELFRDVGISMPEQRVDAYSWQLSGGLRQRAMIAMALSCKPRLLIADEPTTAIDVTTQAQVLALLRELQRKYNTAIIFITHDLGVIAQMASYVVVMYLGRVMEQGAVDEIFHAPKHPYTQALLLVVMYLGRVMEQGAVDEIFHAPKHPYTQALLRSIPGLTGQTRTALPTITGALPHPFNRPSGCPFHPRCPDVMDICAKAVPALEPVGQGQLASCFLHSEKVDAA
jgi:peptide/nickel transport system ATP-binding protein